MSNCAIVGENTLKALIKRYNGIGKPLTADETQILLAFLYWESEKRGGVVYDVVKEDFWSKKK